MTQNQVAYFKHLEDRRHNKEMESQGERNIGETERHNVATESNERAKVVETGRHNVATETNDLFKNTETERHNKASEVLTGQEVDVKKRAQEEEVRTNLANEIISSARVGNEVARTAETARHNVATEAIEAAKAAKPEYTIVNNNTNNPGTNPNPAGDVIDVTPTGEVSDARALLPSSSHNSGKFQPVSPTVDSGVGLSMNGGLHWNEWGFLDSGSLGIDFN